MIEQWKLASTELAVVVSRFFELSIRLESQATANNKDPHNLVKYIDSTLDLLQTTIDSQLVQARVALAKTRNGLSSHRTILSFPQEVLSEIFLHVLFSPPYGIINMEKHVKLIYSRLHSLLGVCTTWRNVALACGALWSVVPLVDSISGRNRPRPLSTQLSIERAGNCKGLYLAMSLARDTYYGRPDYLEPYLSRFNAINIHECINANISLTTVLRMLFQDGIPPLLSKLSLRYSGRQPEQQVGQPTGPFSSSFPSLEPQLIQLFKSLSTLRLNYIALNWQEVVFSNRLVTLQVGGISLGCQPGINSFILALASATELRDLRLISIDAVPDQAENTPTGMSVLPKLESLHLEGLVYNVLSLFIRAISPKACRLTVNLYHDAAQGYVLSEGSVIQPQTATNDEFHARLKGTRIDKLVLNQEANSPWDSPADLQKLLESVPSVKTLVLNYSDLDQDTLKALSGSLNPLSIGSSDRNFPRLEAVEIYCFTTSYLISRLRPGFEEFLATHPIRRLVLNRDIENAVHQITAIGDKDEDEDMLEWLETTVPRFSWIPDDVIPPEMIDTWQLWDL